MTFYCIIIKKKIQFKEHTCNFFLFLPIVLPFPCKPQHEYVLHNHGFFFFLSTFVGLIPQLYSSKPDRELKNIKIFLVCKILEYIQANVQIKYDFATCTTLSCISVYQPTIQIKLIYIRYI